MSQEPDGPPEPDYEPAVVAALDRTNLPGLFLVILGVVNLLFGILWLYNGIRFAMRPAGELWRTVEDAERIVPGYKKLIEDQGITPEAWKSQNTANFLTVAVLTLAAAVVTIMGGARMRGLQSYPLAVTGAVLAAIPCISPMGCCCMGEVVGVWALIVLFDTNVRAAFQ